MHVGHDSLSTSCDTLQSPNSTHQYAIPNPEIRNGRPVIDHDLLCDTGTEEQEANNEMCDGKIPKPGHFRYIARHMFIYC